MTHRFDRNIFKYQLIKGMYPCHYFFTVLFLFFHLSQTWKMLTLNQMLTLNGVKLSLTQPTNRLARYADQQTLFRYPNGDRYFFCPKIFFEREKHFFKQTPKDLYRVRKRVKSQLTTPINKNVRAEFRRFPKKQEILDV